MSLQPEPSQTQPSESQTASNREIHSLTSPSVQFLPFESEIQYLNLCTTLHTEYHPANDNEVRLVESIAQHYWLMQRAIRLQDHLLTQPTLNERAFALYLKYQSTNERAYYRAMHELQNVQKEALKRKIGFESQKREQEKHEAQLRLTNARAASSEIDAEAKANMEVPLPGHAKIPFADLKAAFQLALRELNNTLEIKLKEQAA